MGGLGQFAGLRGSLAKQSERGAFEGGWGGGGCDTPIHTMKLAITLTVILI